MPIDYKKYPPDWLVRRERILQRAGNKCEFCGVKNYALGYRDMHGNFISLETITDALEKQGYDYFENELAHLKNKAPIKIILTIAHLDHDEDNWDVKDERLAALCQKCHINYDKEEKQRRRKQKKNKKLI